MGHSAGHRPFDRVNLQVGLQMGEIHRAIWNEVTLCVLSMKVTFLSQAGVVAMSALIGPRLRPLPIIGSNAAGKRED
jgi:hypothetical protein